MDLLAQMRWPQWSMAVLLIGVCFLLMIVILLQRGRGGGLAGAFGGGGGSSAFGAKTGDVFTWITVIMAGAFVFLAVGANFVFDQSPKPEAATPAPATAIPLSSGTGSPIGSNPITVLPVQTPETKTQDDAAGGTGTGEATPPADASKPTPADDTPGADSGSSQGAPKGKDADSDAGNGADSPTSKGDAPDPGDEDNPSP